MDQNHQKKAPKSDHDRSMTLEQLSSLSVKTKSAYDEALQDFRDSQNIHSPVYFMGRD